MVPKGPSPEPDYEEFLAGRCEFQFPRSEHAVFKPSISSAVRTRPSVSISGDMMEEELALCLTPNA